MHKKIKKSFGNSPSLGTQASSTFDVFIQVLYHFYFYFYFLGRNKNMVISIPYSSVLRYLKVAKARLASVSRDAGRLMGRYTRYRVEVGIGR